MEFAQREKQHLNVFLPLKKQSPMNSCLLLRSYCVSVSMLTTQSLKYKVCVCAVKRVHDCSTMALCYYPIKKSTHTQKKPNSEM